MDVIVRVRAGARKEKIEIEKDGAVLLSVREPRERNAANKRVRHILAAHYGVPPESVRLVRGQRSARKVFSVAT